VISGKIWVIRGYEGLEMVFEREVSLGALSEREVVTLLQRMQARHLTEDEILNASLRRNARRYSSNLEVVRESKSGKFSLMTVGTGHWYTASVEDAE
jgi:hypothetical protein